MDHAKTHQRANPDRGAAIVCKHEERARVRNDAAVQRHAVHRRRHGMLAHAIVDVASVPALRRHRAGRARLGIVRAREVCRAADHFRHEMRDHFQRLTAPHARCLGGAAFSHGLLVLEDRLAEILRQTASNGHVELALLRARRETFLPGRMLFARALTRLQPGRFNGVRNLERFVRPVEGFPDARDLLGAIRSAVRLAGARQFRRAETDDRLHREEDRLLLLGRPLQRLGHILLVVPVHAAADPSGRLDARTLVGPVGQVRPAIDSDGIVVKQNDQLVQLQMPGECDRFLADAFHEAAVAGDHPGAVIHELVAEARIQVALGDRHADRRRDALPQGARRRLDTGRDEVFRVTRRLGAQLAEIADVVAAHRGVAGQVEQRIDQHRAMARRQDEPVPVRPGGIARIIFQELPEQHRRRIRHAQGQADMARFCRFHGVHGQGPNGIRHVAICDSHSADLPVFSRFVLGQTCPEPSRRLAGAVIPVSPETS